MESIRIAFKSCYMTIRGDWQNNKLGQKDVEVFCVALVTYKLTIIYEINDPSAKYVNLTKN